MNLRVGKFKTKEGSHLHYETWTPPSVKGGILFVHGVGDHCSRYRAFVQHFTQKGYKVCLYDQRGHGRSEGRRVHVKKFSQYWEDLGDFSRFCRNGDEKFPWFLIGHSLGGQIVVNFLAHTPGLFRAAVATSPNLKIFVSLPEWKKILGRLLLALWPTKNLKGYTDPNFLTHDPLIIQQYRKDPLVKPYMTIRLAREIYDNIQHLPQLHAKIQTPLLLLHGSEDHYCLPEGTRKFFSELILDQKQLKIYEGMYHELLNETRKEEVFEDIERWFRSSVSV